MEFFKIFPSEIEGRKDISVEIGKGFGDAMDILKELKCKGKLKHSAKNNVCIRLLQRLKSTHSLIRGVLIQSCSTGAKNFSNYVFCHPQFSGVIQNIENHCGKIFIKNQFLLFKIDYFDNNRHRQTGVKMAQRFSIFWITPLNCG